MENFLKIYRNFYGKVYTFVLSMVKIKANAQDITQNIFLKLNTSLKINNILV